MLKAQRLRYLKRTPYISQKYKAGRFKLGVIFTAEFIGDYAGILLRDNDVAIVVNPNRKAVSLRAVNDGIHLGELAGTFACGGGHPRAAGISYDDILGFNAILADLINLIKEM